MPVVRLTLSAAFCCALLLVGCRNEPDTCPSGDVIADPSDIPSGTSSTTLTVEVHDPFPDADLEIVTELSAFTGTIADPFARETTYSCAHDVSGPIEICVTTTYADGADPEPSEVAGVQGSSETLRGPNVYLFDTLECSNTRCVEVICPDVKNLCPVVSSLTVDPPSLSENEVATIEVVADDPDDGPKGLVTTLSARHGTIDDPSALKASYTCDPAVGGAIEICVVASDGDAACDTEVCTSVRCPGDPLENTCPIIERFTASPNPIPSGEDVTTVRVDAMDPDEFPQPLSTELSSPTGAFEDRSASETIFRCGVPGPVEIAVKASDGDTECDEIRTLTVQCPSDVRRNRCPLLFVINGVPRTIPPGETSTRVETRGQDTDGLPLPLVLTLHALWGSFENTVNIQEPNNVVAQNATYVCDRPGVVEVCVEATDGACVKPLCTDLTCPDDVPTPP